MPRCARKKSSTGTYHVIIKGADRQLLFEETSDYKKYLDLLSYYKEECHFELFAYCLMSNHVHLVIRHSDICPLDKIFRHINTSYAVWFNKKYNRTGFVQNDRYYSEPIEDKDYLFTVIRYIHFNPFKAGIESAPGESYPWTSFTDYLHPSTSLTDTEFILKLFGGKDYFKQFHCKNVSKISDDVCMDIDFFHSKMPDDIAKNIIHEISQCQTTADFQKLSLQNRNAFIKSIHKKGVSIRQINRLTGTPKGIIERILAKHN